MIRIGLTGGIGSGKSVVASLFNVMGYPCYDSDSAMKRLYTENAQLKDDMKKTFGNGIYTSDGQLDNKLFASILFNDPTIQKHLSNIAYPCLVEDYMNWEKMQHTTATLFESAILLQTDLPLAFDAIISVTAPAGLRIERVCRRSGLTPKEVQDRMNRQPSDDMLKARSTAVITNDSTHPVLPQVERVINQICNL